MTEPATNTATTEFEKQRGVLLGVAYRVLRRWPDAEDVVQETWLRWRRVDHAEVQNARAFLTCVAIRLALDRLRRVGTRNEAYVGSWQPAETLSDLNHADLTEPDVADQVELADSVSTVIHVLLKTLSPLERAVFVLREAFALSYKEIAETLDRNEDTVRQLARRARQHVRQRDPRYATEKSTQDRLAAGFLAATIDGDLAALLAILAPNALAIPRKSEV